MKIHEYHARQLLADAGVPVPQAEMIETTDQASAAYAEIGGRVVVKAQVFAGGRGKAGFVKLCRNEAEVRQAVQFMLTHRMVNPQTGPDGIPVKKLLLTAAVDIEKEYYVGMAIDRAKNCPVLMVSTEGGVEIEEIAARNPDAIVKQWLHPHLGLLPFQIYNLTRELGLANAEHTQTAEDVFRGLAKVFLEYDAALAEINPLALTQDSKLLALDAKITFDDNAFFRHKTLADLFDPSEENPDERRAQAAGLSYIAMDGNIGCIVNGAGLAMATMDLIKLHGGEPANFLDVGGSVTTEGATEAFRIILADHRVKGILVNIFGGIAQCDTIAEALIAAAKEVEFNVPVVVRLEGTHVERALELLDTAHIPGLITASDLTAAAEKVCAVV